MIEVFTNNTITTMSSENSPSTYIQSGDTLVVQTKDCFSDKVVAETDSLNSIKRSELNPCTGPIFVSEAEPGDVIKVSIIKIDLSDKGAFLVDKEYLEQYGIKEGDRSVHVKIQDGNVVLDEKHLIPIKPMVGTIGVAPKCGEIATVVPGEHGGNMDCSIIGENSELYLPVFHKGALLSLGDVHAVMGDGEFIDYGVEAAAKVTIKVDVIKGEVIPTPLVITEQTLATISSRETLDEAAKASSEKMFKYLLEVKKLPFDLALGLMCTSANSRNCQFVNRLKTVRCEMPIALCECK